MVCFSTALFMLIWQLHVGYTLIGCFACNSDGVEAGASLCTMCISRLIMYSGIFSQKQRIQILWENQEQVAIATTNMSTVIVCLDVFSILFFIYNDLFTFILISYVTFLLLRIIHL